MNLCGTAASKNIAARGTIGQKWALRENPYFEMIYFLKIILYYYPTYVQCNYPLTGVCSVGITEINVSLNEKYLQVYTRFGMPRVDLLSGFY